MEIKDDIFGEIIEDLLVDVPIEARIELAEEDIEDDFDDDFDDDFNDDFNDYYDDYECGGYEWTEEDSWDALTDGMYGDMPSSPWEFDAMMDAMGF